jgi:hypothetical protein
MRRQGAATPGATHRVSVGVAPSIRLPRQPRTAPLRRLPPHRSPWRRQFGARHPGSTAENAATGRGNPGGNSQGVCGSCPQHSLAAAATHRPAQALAASPLAMAAPIRRKAPREHRGKCSGRAQQPRGPLTGCLWDVPPASACRGSRTPPRSGACHLLPCQAPCAENR